MNISTFQSINNNYKSNLTYHQICNLSKQHLINGNYSIYFVETYLKSIELSKKLIKSLSNFPFSNDFIIYLFHQEDGFELLKYLPNNFDNELLHPYYDNEFVVANAIYLDVAVPFSIFDGKDNGYLVNFLRDYNCNDEYLDYIVSNATGAFALRLVNISLITHVGCKFYLRADDEIADIVAGNPHLLVYYLREKENIIVNENDISVYFRESYFC